MTASTEHATFAWGRIPARAAVMMAPGDLKGKRPLIIKTCDVCERPQSRDVHLNEVMDEVHVCDDCADKAGLMASHPHSKLKSFVGGMLYVQTATREALKAAAGREATIRAAGEPG